MRKRISMRQIDALTVDEAFDIFIQKAEVRNLSERTIKTYKNHFMIFCKSVDRDKIMEQVDIDVVDDFVLYLKENSNANDITIASYLRTIRSFLYWAMKEGYVANFNIPIPKTEKKVKETYSQEELRKLLKKPNLKKCDFTEYKIWVFENYLLGTGNRISSALNLKIRDIDFDSSNIIIRKTKNRHQMIIPISSTLESVLKEYLKVRNGKDDDYVFCNAYGGQGELRSYQQAVADYNIKRNVYKTSCHLFRHTFAKNWLLNGGDIFRLQKILGHSDLTVVKEYVNLFTNDLCIDFDKFNPLDNFNRKQAKIKMK